MNKRTWLSLVALVFLFVLLLPTSPASAAITGVVTTAAGLNCRELPSTSGKIIGAFSVNTQLTILGTQGDFHKVTGKNAWTGKSITGYSAKAYIKLSSSSLTPSVSNPPQYEKFSPPTAKSLQVNLNSKQFTIAGNTLPEVQSSFVKALSANYQLGKSIIYSGQKVVAKVVCIKTRTISVTYMVGPQRIGHDGTKVTKTQVVPSVIEIHYHTHNSKYKMLWYGNVLASQLVCDCGAVMGDVLSIEIDTLPTMIQAPALPSVSYSTR